MINKQRAIMFIPIVAMLACSSEPPVVVIRIDCANLQNAPKHGLQGLIYSEKVCDQMKGSKLEVNVLVTVGETVPSAPVSNVQAFSRMSARTMLGTMGSIGFCVVYGWMYRVDQLFSIPSWSSWSQGTGTEENEQRREYTDRLTACVRILLLSSTSGRLILSVWHGMWWSAALALAFALLVTKATRVILCQFYELSFMLPLLQTMLVRGGIAEPHSVESILVSFCGFIYCAALVESFHGFLASIGCYSVSLIFALSFRDREEHAQLVRSLVIANGLAVAIFAIKSIEKQRLADVAFDLKYSACAAVPIGLILAVDPWYGGHAFWSSWEALSDTQIKKVWQVATWSAMWGAFVFRFPPENLAKTMNQFIIPGPAPTLQILSAAARVVAVAFLLVWILETTKRDNWRGLEVGAAVSSAIFLLSPMAQHRTLCVVQRCATYLLLPGLLMPWLEETTALLWPLCVGLSFVGAALHISLGEHLSEILFVNAMVFAYGTNQLRAASSTAAFLSCLALCVKMTVMNHQDDHNRQGGEYGIPSIAGSCSTSGSS